MDFIDAILGLERLTDNDGCVGWDLVELIDKAQDEAGTDDLGDLLFERASSDYDLNRLLFILDTSVWCGSDNGAALLRTFERWLDGDDADRIYVVLHSDIYPFVDANKMYAKLEEVSERFPRFKARCTTLIRERAALEEKGRRHMEEYMKSRKHGKRG